MLFKALALSLLTTASAPAAPAVPDCWTTNGQSIGFNKQGTEIEDGGFNVIIELKRATKEQLVEAMKLANGGPLQGQGYPIILDDSIILTTRATESRTPPDRARLQSETTAQLTKLLAVPGVVSAECNIINRIPEDELRQHDDDEGLIDEAFLEGIVTSQLM